MEKATSYQRELVGKAYLKVMENYRGRDNDLQLAVLCDYIEQEDVYQDSLVSDIWNGYIAWRTIRKWATDYRKQLEAELTSEKEKEVIRINHESAQKRALPNRKQLENIQKHKGVVVIGSDEELRTTREQLIKEKTKGALWLLSEDKKPLQRTVGVFSDVHLPFDHPNFIFFIIDAFKERGVTDIVCTGDFVDNHAISRHQNSVSSKGANDELDLVIAHAREYVLAFPELDLTVGNHDDIPARQLATLGMSPRLLKKFGDIYELPDTWRVHTELDLFGVLYAHGINCGGAQGPINNALIKGQSFVMGHFHGYGGCDYRANGRTILFGMNAGCGIDYDTYAFEYGKYSKYKPTLGCGVVYNDKHAEFVPMDEHYFRSNFHEVISDEQKE